MIFRDSIPHPAQSLCTLRNHRRRWPRNPRYQADSYPLLGPDLHRQDRTTFFLARSFDHLVGTTQERDWDRDAERSGSLHVDDQFDFRGLLYRQVGWFLAPKNPCNVDAYQAVRVRNVASIAHETAGC